MLSPILRTVAAHGLFRAGDRVIVAVSGGPDSMALLHALWELAPRLGLHLEVAGVDHGLRATAAAELDLVATRARALDLPFHRLSVDVAGERRRARGSIQEVARRVRLRALAELAARRGAQRVALGHQADDQAETLLLRIVRGTGVAGLRGIPYWRQPFVRPLLDVRRAEILRYLRRRSIPFAEDPSNADARFTRARVRHHLLPVLAEENPRIVEGLLALAESARTAGLVGSPSADGEGQQDPPLPRQVRAVVRRLAVRGGSAAVDLEGGRRVEVVYGRVRVVPRPPAPKPVAVASPEPLTVSSPGTYRWPPYGSIDIRLETAASNGEPSFDADRLQWPLVLRARRSGDRMRPRGGAGHRRLSDLMIDAKIARGERAGLPVLATAAGEVLFVPGLRPAEVGRPTHETRRRVWVVCHPEIVAGALGVTGQRTGEDV
jgi:tRNA(Ile)-lysidine synthase